MGAIIFMKDYSLEKLLSLTKDRKPNFNNLLSVLKKESPSRPALFELFLNDPLEHKLAGLDKVPTTDEEITRCKIKAFRNAGYDYVTVHASNFLIKRGDFEHKESLSANDGVIIYDRESFDAYEWENPADFYNGRIEKNQDYLPDGMKFVVMGPGGVLENVTALVGFDNMCFMLADDPELLETIFDHVGQIVLDYYTSVVGLDAVGAIISNDDWGFNTQTMLAPADMRKYVFKWHKKITDLAHNAGKPIILHSCGNLTAVWDDIIYDMKYDGKHSYEDVICPVEQMYDKLKGKIAVMGGIDMDYVCRSPIDEVYKRARAMVEKTGCKGYALGTGNSIPPYVPHENYFAMLSAALN